MTVGIMPKDSSVPLPPDWREQLRARWPDGERLRAAWALARDVDALEDLLAGRAVHPDRIDRDELVKASRANLVQLRAPIDLLEPTG